MDEIVREALEWWERQGKFLEPIPDEGVVSEYERERVPRWVEKAKEVVEDAE